MTRDAWKNIGVLSALCWLVATGAQAQQRPAPKAPEKAAQPPAAEPPTAAQAPAQPPAAEQPPASVPAATQPSAEAKAAAPAPAAAQAAGQPEAASEAGAAQPPTSAPTAPAEPAATSGDASPNEGPAPRARTSWKPSRRPPPLPRAPSRPEPELPPVEDGRFALGLSFTPRWNSDPAYDFFADDDVVVSYGLWVGYDVLRFADRFALAAELGWSTDFEEQSNLVRVFDSELRTCAWELSADLRWEALEVLWPHVRLGGGIAKSKLKLEGGLDGDFADVDLSGTLVAGLGATLKTPAGLFETLRSFSLGLRLEVGYRVMAPTDVALVPEDEPEDGAIEVTRSRLGEVPRSGPYVGISLVGRI